MHRLFWTCLVVVYAGGASANDTVTRLDNNGLVIMKTDAIEMRSEELFISEKLIRVQYKFFNRSGNDLTIHVAFPMPDLLPEFVVRNVSVATDFTTTIDGVQITPQVEQKAIAESGADRTDLLRKFSVPLDLTLAEAELRLGQLARTQQDELAKAGLVRRGDPDPKTFISPHWTVKTAYYWEQTFPAGREITVEHSYRPSVGGELGVGLHYDLSERTEWSPEDIGRYCMETSFLAAADRVRKTADKSTAFPYSQKSIDYVLKTGANWAGPIRSFRLVIDKGRPENLVTFCGEGVKKISATQFEMRKTDFTPQTDLHILLVTKNW
jgi:hypothetical protein